MKLPGRIVGALLALVGLGVLAVAVMLLRPLWSLHQTEESARLCLRKIEAARGPAFPDCGGLVREFDGPSRISYTRDRATYRAEELWSRLMIGLYRDAAVGVPNRDQLARGAKWVREAENTVDEGSKRLVLEDLGPAETAPNLGKLSVALGDRRSLIDYHESFGLWTVRLRAVDAALLEGDLAQAETIAKRYAEWDPRDADLRTTLGAVLCLGKTPSVGIDVLERVPADRADKRYAAIARNYGEVLGVIRACAHKSGTEPPAPPREGAAGIADQESMLAALDLRLEKTPLGAKGAAGVARRLLERDEGLDARGARITLVAAMLATVDLPTLTDLDEKNTDLARREKLASLLRDRSGDTSIRKTFLVPGDVIDEPKGLRPILPVGLLETALERLSKLAEDEVDAGRREAFVRGATALAIDAALAHARLGRGASVRALVEKAKLDPVDKAMTMATLLYVAGDAKEALRAAEVTTADKPKSAALHYVSALAAASLGDVETARRHVKSGLDEVKFSDDADLVIELRFLSLGLGMADAGTQATVTASLGLADRSARYLTLGERAAEQTLGAFATALSSSDEERRKFRYQLMKWRGDSPKFALGQMLAVARLLGNDASEEAVDVWLDAFYAIDARRFPKTAYAFMRREAASITGGKATTAAWTARLEKLRAVRGSEPDTEIARFLDY